MFDRFIRLIVFCVVLGAILGIALPAESVGNERFPQSVASGDPRPDSVIVWTRVLDDAGLGALVLEVASDADFTSIVVTRDLALDPGYDGVAKVRVHSLEPGTTYWYRFLYGTGAVMESSPVGRTRTAPWEDDPRPMKFAVIYGQDFTGRYYNSYLKLLLDHDEDLDFVVHLGDYVYETTGDPTFQDPTSDRKVEFDDIDGAITMGSGDSTYYAASSLANYRTLYRTFRSDPMLQQVHERWPMVVIWDDHEFSDDCWGATATYFDGRGDEEDVERRRRSEQAFLEWIPTEVGLSDEGELAIDDSMLFPNSMIYRDFRFGSLLHLSMTDYRSFRPDHLIAEDAFPGALALDEPTLRQLMGSDLFDQMAGSFDPYLDMDVWASHVPIFKQTCSIILAQLVMQENPDMGFFAALSYAEDLLTGNISTMFINSLFQAAGLQPYFVGDVVADMPRGLPYLFVGKTSLNDSMGSRYMLLKDGFDLVAVARYFLSGGADQDALGGPQFAWLAGVLQHDTAWKVMASSVSMSPMILDFSNEAIAPILPPEFPEALRTRIMVNADQWDGFPQKLMELQGLLATVPNSVVISGDIHSWFVTDHQNGLIEFTAPAASSESLEDLILGALQRHPILGQIPGLEDLVAQFGPLMQITSLDDSVTPSDIVGVDLKASGYMLVEVTAEALTSTMVAMNSEETRNNYYDDPDALEGIFTEHVYTVQEGVVTPLVP